VQINAHSHRTLSRKLAETSRASTTGWRIITQNTRIPGWATAHRGSTLHHFNKSRVSGLMGSTPINESPCPFSQGTAGVITATSAHACDQPIVLSNWKSCAIGPLSEKGGDADWPAVPAWTRDSAIRPYLHDDPRLLANRGLCKANVRRVILCLRAWHEASDKDACSYLICSGHQV
jgi:hypothetical protein